MELEFRNIDFCGGRKTGEAGENTSKQERINNKVSGGSLPAGLESASHWWETSVLTAAPPICFPMPYLPGFPRCRKSVVFFPRIVEPILPLLRIMLDHEFSRSTFLLDIMDFQMPWLITSTKTYLIATANTISRVFWKQCFLFFYKFNLIVFYHPKCFSDFLGSGL